MAKSTLNVENLPLKIEGKIEMVPKRQYCNHTASTFAVKYKAQVTKSQISDIIDMIVAGKELEEGNEPIWADIYNAVKADIDIAQDKAQELIEKAQREEKEKKEADEQKKSRELALVNAANNTDVAATFATLGDKFDLGNMDRCVPKGDVSDEDLMSALVAGMRMEDFSNWAKGDLVSELEKRGHENAMVTLCESTGIPYKSIYRMAVTARNVPPPKRLSGVSFTTYAEVANARFSKDENENKKLLENTIARVGEKVTTGNEQKDAVRNAGIITTAQDARKAVQAAQGKQPPTPADPLAVDFDKHTFIIVDCEGGTIAACIGYPKSLEDTDAVIIHAKTARKAFGQGAKVKWVQLETHTEPEPEPKKEEVKETKETKKATATVKAGTANATENKKTAAKKKK